MGNLTLNITENIDVSTGGFQYNYTTTGANFDLVIADVNAFSAQTLKVGTAFVQVAKFADGATQAMGLYDKQKIKYIRIRPTTASRTLTVQLSDATNNKQVNYFCATDEAIYEGINQQAEMIIVAPCCHKEVRRYIEMKLGDEDNIEVAFGHLSALMDHGIYRERTCEMVTDTMRALCLELAGYETKVFEFIGGEHTAKNVMITAVARENDKDDEDDSSERKIKIRRKLRRLAQYFGIESPKLAVLMGEAPLCSSVCKAIKSTKNKKRSIRRLRPLDNDDDERSDIDGDHEILDYKFSSWTKAIL